jgi:hypothetical protein
LGDALHDPLRAPARGLAAYVFWNGPLGVFEVPPFDAGTRAVAQAVAATGGRSVVGGGDTAAVLDRLGLADLLAALSSEATFAGWPRPGRGERIAGPVYCGYGRRR